LKYGLDLVSRRYKESISDVIVRALNDSLTSEHGGLLLHVDGSEHLVDLLRLVWDENEVLRTVKLALLEPSLLNRTEELVWEAVQADDKYWAKASATKKGRAGTPAKRQLDALQLDALEADWESLVEKASAFQR
jgi:hypothetical protein